MHTRPTTACGDRVEAKEFGLISSRTPLSLSRIVRVADAFRGSQSAFQKGKAAVRASEGGREAEER